MAGKPIWRLIVPTRDGEDLGQTTAEEIVRTETIVAKRRWQTSLNIGCVVRIR